MRNIKSEDVYGSGLYETDTTFKFGTNHKIKAVVSIVQDWTQKSLEYRVTLFYLESGKRKFEFIDHTNARSKCRLSNVDFDGLILTAKINHHNRINPARQ